MGIINLTPDSFSGDGLVGLEAKDLAVSKAIKMVDEGADILDIGGESSRPGSKPITEAEEMDRVIPILEAIVSEIDIPISIDTCKETVADSSAFVQM